MKGKPDTLFVFGDSIVYGRFDMEMGGWVDRLKLWGNKIIVETKRARWVNVYNLGIAGGTTDEALPRIKAEVEERMGEHDMLYIVFAFGINDMALHVVTEKRSVAPEIFLTNLKKLIEISRALSGTPIFLTATPVNEATKGVPNERGEIRTNKDIEMYNDIIRTVCSEERVEVIDVYKKFSEVGQENLIFPEGLHPNAKGHELIFNLVRDHFTKKLGL